MPLILVLIFMLSASVQAQNPDWNAIEKRFENADKMKDIKALAYFINNNFDGDQQQAAALYWWLGKHIRYDVNSALRQRSVSYKSQQQITNEAFSSRKGVCEGYAGIMDSVFRLLNIPSYIISGYTRQGQAISAVPHAWIVAKINGNWRFFDPTWASGFLNGRRFEAQFNPGFFSLSPEEMRKTHIPYDPIWQFNAEPISHQEFISNKISASKSSQNFAYTDSIQAFLSLQPDQQLAAEYNRIRRDYYPHEALKNRMDFLSSNLKIARHNQQVNMLNMATMQYNEAVLAFNGYLKLQGESPTGNRKDKQAQLLKAANELVKSQNLLKQIGDISADLRGIANQLQKSVRDLKKQLEKEGVLFE
ncbi:MAG: transglutaminase domain-containing protein [Bacteroidales bacterium]|nr:transglutaminase domain-containing protein [Bacteroidales bacterium]